MENILTVISMTSFFALVLSWAMMPEGKTHEVATNLNVDVRPA